MTTIHVDIAGVLLDVSIMYGQSQTVDQTRYPILSHLVIHAILPLVISLSCHSTVRKNTSYRNEDYSILLYTIILRCCLRDRLCVHDLSSSMAKREASPRNRSFGTYPSDHTLKPLPFVLRANNVSGEKQNNFV